MNYFRPYPSQLEEIEIAAWESQIAQAESTPWLRQLLAQRRDQIFPRFVATYRELRHLPRDARRTLQRHFARSSEVRNFISEHFQTGADSRAVSKLAQSLAGVALLLALGQSTAGAATINVTTNTATIVADGRCSLPEAIINANNDAATHSDCAAGSGADTIILPAKSTHSLKSPLANYYGANGLPLINTAITIEGNGGKISRPKSKTLYRLMAVTNSGDLTLQNVTLSGGVEDHGGAIFNSGNLTLSTSTISGGNAATGGGVFNASSGSLSITSSALAKNTAVHGGAISNYLGNVEIQNTELTGNRANTGGAVFTRGGSLTVSNSTISGNRAFDAGGFWNEDSDLIVENSTISQNRATAGGGFYVRSGNVVINETVISNNASEDAAGMWIANGLAASSSVTIQNSTISGNKSSFNGGGILLQSSGGSLTIQNSAIVGNQARFVAGGVEFTAGKLTIEDSTISSNRAGTEGGGIWSWRNITLSNSTISGNSARSGGGVFQGLYQLTLTRSLVAGNKANTGAEIVIRTSNTATVIADDFNLFGTNGNSGVVGFNPGATDIVPSVPIGNILAPLADNGGPTPTHALVAGSPAIDAVPGAHPDCSGTDQRGVARPQGVGCDIGAFEK